MEGKGEQKLTPPYLGLEQFVRQLVPQLPHFPPTQEENAQPAQQLGLPQLGPAQQAYVPQGEEEEEVETAGIGFPGTGLPAVGYVPFAIPIFAEVKGPPPTPEEEGNKLTPDDEIFAALATDAQHRYVGVTGDLMPLNGRWLRGFWDLKTPGYTLPTILPVGSNPPEAKRLADTFFMELSRIIGDGLIVAGSAAANLISHTMLANDIDIFIVGLDAAQARARIDKFMNALRIDNYRVYRTAYTFTFASRNVQVVLRLYKTISEVLHGFDMGSAAVAYDGKTLWTTSLGLLAHERGLNVIDLDKRRASYEIRLHKYFERGIGIVFPNLNTENIEDNLDLPHLRVENIQYDNDRHNMHATNVFPQSVPRPDGNKLKKAAWEASDTYDLGIATAFNYDPDRLNLTMAREGKDGYLEADITRLVGTSTGYQFPFPREVKVATDIWDIKPAFWDRAQARFYLIREMKKNAPYLRVVRNAVGEANLKILQQNTEVHPTAGIIFHEKKINWDQMLDDYERRVSRLRNMSFPDFAAPTEGTRLLDAPNSIPIVPITAKDWYGKYYKA